jgi:hypothetical protein
MAGFSMGVSSLQLTDEKMSMVINMPRMNCAAVLVPIVMGIIFRVFHKLSVIYLSSVDATRKTSRVRISLWMFIKKIIGRMQCNRKLGKFEKISLF